MEGTSACDGKYDVNPMGSDFFGNRIEEKEWTVILGFSLSADWWGKSGTIEVGVFRSKVLDKNDNATYLRGQYWAVELGNGTTADVTMKKADVGFVATSGHSYAPYTGYLEGYYNNTGVDFWGAGFEGGVSKITTFSDPVYHGWTVDAGRGTATAGGHITYGKGGFFNVEQMNDNWTWDDWKDEEDKPSKKFSSGLIDKMESEFNSLKRFIEELVE